jgi:hypothetical protein
MGVENHRRTQPSPRNPHELPEEVVPFVFGAVEPDCEEFDVGDFSKMHGMPSVDPRLPTEVASPWGSELLSGSPPANE